MLQQHCGEKQIGFQTSMQMQKDFRMNAKLRVGFLLDSLLLPAWSYTAIERMIDSHHADVVLVVIDRSQTASRAQASSPWLYRIFMAMDEKVFVRGANASVPVDASPMFSKVAIMDVGPLGEDRAQYFSEADAERIRSYQLDVLVKMGFGQFRDDVMSIAEYGIWTYRWGDDAKIEDGLTGFWEVARGWPETGASLQQFSNCGQHGKTLTESWFFTYPYSPARNRNYVLWAAASFLSRQVTRLHQLGGTEYSQEVEENSKTKPEILQSNEIPSSSAILGILAKLMYKNLLEVLRRRFRPDRWELLFCTAPHLEKNISSFQRISPPRDRFWADPHIVYEAPNYYIFVEEYLYRTQRGHISVIEMDQQGNYKQPVTILRKDYHLSFPFVFNWLGHYYMIPESSENKTVDLYECIEFPHRWGHKLTLMKDIKAVDTTVVYRDGKWWLFTAIAEQPAAAPQVELFLFYSDELFTDHWNPHPRNPIVSDVKKARGAGGIFIKDGRLFRPSQYGSSSYGHGFDVNEIVTLSETEYRERTVTEVRPEGSPGIRATHTYASRGNLTVIDAIMRQPKWAKTS